MIPLATTTITIKRPLSTSADPYEGVSAVGPTVAAGVRAHISSPSGTEAQVGGRAEVVDAVLLCDVADLAHSDHIVDDETSETWQVLWVRKRRGLGLDHMTAGLRATSGASSG